MHKRGSLRGGGLALMLTLGLAPAAPDRATAGECEDPPAPVILRIVHGQLGEIGWHRVEFGCENGALVVETTAEIEVKILFATAYRREIDWREVWDGDQLLAFDGTTVDDGQSYEVSARLEGDRMVIEGPSGRVEAPSGVVPSHPWNQAVIERPLLFDVRDGNLLAAKTTVADEEEIAAEAGEVLAQKYVTEGDLERELWYAKDGRWLQWRLRRAGGTITMTRQ